MDRSRPPPRPGDSRRLRDAARVLLELLPATSDREIEIDAASQQVADAAAAAIRRAVDAGWRDDSQAAPSTEFVRLYEWAAYSTKLGSARRAAGDAIRAIEAHRRTIGWLGPLVAAYPNVLDYRRELAGSHVNLGNALKSRGEVAAAVEAFEEALRIDREHPEALCSLGLVLRDRGRLRDALPLLERGHRLGSGRPGWPHPSGKWLDDCRLALSWRCIEGRQYATAARLLSEVVSPPPDGSDDVRRRYRYDAARAAVLVAAHRGEDEPRPSDEDCRQWRRRALAWLRADLEAAALKFGARESDGHAEAVRMLRAWTSEPALASVRDSAAIALLPDDERPAWRAFWAEVEAHIGWAETDPTPIENRPPTSTPKD